MGLQEQSRIGWLDLFEGLASKSWQRLQHNYYTSNHIRKSNRKWIRGVPSSLHHMGWKQWDHRNKINKTVTKPDEKAALEALDFQIIKQVSTRVHELVPGDCRRFDKNLITLLNKFLPQKKSWLANVATARQRFFRIQQQDKELDLLQKEQSALLRWMKGLPYKS